VAQKGCAPLWHAQPTKNNKDTPTLDMGDVAGLNVQAISDSQTGDLVTKT